MRWTYAELKEQVDRCAAGLISFGLQPGAGACLGRGSVGRGSVSDRQSAAEAVCERRYQTTAKTEAPTARLIPRTMSTILRAIASMPMTHAVTGTMSIFRPSRRRNVMIPVTVREAANFMVSLRSMEAPNCACSLAYAKTAV
jgi:hypothetical protein